MGGDHKCPVCQATFTRPQHVARHMRSHTGDRPYKCQYCGDQFARSDLLSRHVNKCHAGEKPANPSTTGRRKGSASASRATTSKQACDQCVQSSLPCDGSNPCAKCIQRKCRCTFVKFHRQTAPIGPGHNPRPQINSVSSRLPGYASADDFLLAPAPTSIAPIPGDPSSYNTSFTFPQLYPSTTDSAPPSLSMPPGDDYGKYRSQADYMRRQTLPFPSGPGVPPPDALYHDGRPSSATSWLGWGSHTTSQLAAGSRPPLVDEPKSDFHPAQSSSFTYPPVAADPYVGSYANRRLPQDRRTSVDFSSDSSHSIPSSAASSSVHLPLVDHQQQLAYHVSLDQLHEQIKDIFAHPRSSSSSAPGETLADTGSQDAQAQAHANFLQSHSSTSRPPGEDRSSGSPPNASDTHPPQPGEFSSAFGLMSLDDPAILAGLSNDGAPFFTDNGMDIYPGDPDATPMPPKPISKVSSHSIQTLSPNSTRDAETKELKDFWRQYLRTPFPGTTPQALGSANPMSASATPVSPGLGYRRVRVSSLPTVQTPPTERSQFNYPNANAAAANANGATSSMRTTLHGNPDDLRSYEAAILARRAPLNLNLNIAPKRARGATASSTTSPMVVGMSADPMYEGSRPGSSSSVSSSLANAFGKQRQQQQQPQGGNVTFAYHTSEYGHGHGHGSATPPSRGSTASLEEGGSGERDALRPSFKRLPSQTLGPANSKRAMLDYDGDDSDVAEDDQHQYRFTTRSSSGSMHHPHPHAHHPPQQQHSPHHHHHHQQQQEQQPPGMNTGMMAPPPPSSMPSGNLANRRRRRMSAPDTSPTVPTFAAAGQL